jgi:cytoskeletal protein CcmA (bactofilin family)
MASRSTSPNFLKWLRASRWRSAAKVSGVICGKTVALEASSGVEGDIYHMSLMIEQGSKFDGSSRRAADEVVLNAVMDAKIADPDSL